MNTMAEILKALSDPTRLAVLEAVADGSLCVSALAEKVGVSQSAVSQHLRVLRQAGLVTAEKQGYWVHYRADEKTIAKFADRFGGWADKLAAKAKTPCPHREKCAKLPRKGQRAIKQS